MSGEAFNNVYSTVLRDRYFEATHDLRDMEQWLRSKRKHEVADELLTLIIVLESAEHRIEVNVRRLEGVIRAVAYWASADTGEETFDESIKEFFNGEA